MSHKVYFASDLHIGAPSLLESRSREVKFVEWLEKAAEDATEIHLLGDIFDFWFEYRRSVPKGGTRILGTIARITDRGIPVHYHIGNRDIWSFGYLEEECGVILHKKPQIFEWDGLKCFVAHGDGLGPGEYTYKALKKVYQNRLCQWLFKLIHPDFGIALANLFIKKKHFKTDGVSSGEDFESEDNEILFAFCKDHLTKDSSIDCFIMGHRHLPLDLKINQTNGAQSRYINIGDWTSHFSWACLEKGEITLYK